MRWERKYGKKKRQNREVGKDEMEYRRGNREGGTGKMELRR